MQPIQPRIGFNGHGISAAVVSAVLVGLASELANIASAALVAVADTLAADLNQVRTALRQRAVLAPLR